MFVQDSPAYKLFQRTCQNQVGETKTPEELYSELKLLVGYSKLQKILQTVEKIEQRSQRNSVWSPILHAITPSAKETAPQVKVEIENTVEELYEPQERLLVSASDLIKPDCLSSQKSHQSEVVRYERPAVSSKYSTLMSPSNKFQTSVSKKIRSELEGPSIVNKWEQTMLEFQLGVQSNRSEKKIANKNIISRIKYWKKKTKGIFKDIKCRLEVYHYNHL